MRFFLELQDDRLKEVANLLEGNEVLDFEELKNGKTATMQDIFIFSPAHKWKESDFALIPNSSVVFGGNISSENKSILERTNYHNVMLDEDFVVKNAILTAEGFLSCLISNTKRSIFDEKILVLGSGRVAKALWQVFGKLGLKFDVSMRNQKELHLSTIFAQNAFDIKDLNLRAKNYSVVINTIPEVLFDDEFVFALGAVLFELSSKKSIADDKNINYISCPALPAKFSPKTAGKYLFESVKKNLGKEL